MDQGVIDYITNIFDIPKLTQQVSAVQMPLPLSRLAEIPLDGSVNQCQGFCYNSKKDVFALACINSDNTKQIIYEINPKTFTVVAKYEYSYKSLLGHMNTLTYNSVNNRYYTTNAVVNGYNLTPIEADSMIVEAPIKLKEKVFNFAYDKVRNEYVQDDGSTVVGDYDVVPLIDRFVEEHPDFAYHGHKGIVALTGYNGILGYRTDISYQTRPDDLNDDKKAWLDAHPDFDLDTERAGAKKVADAMKAEGWTFASHTWGHKNMSSISMERLQTDTKNFKENVDPLIGGTDIIIFAFGADINTGGEYTGDEKFDYLKSQGYNYYCNVDSNKYFVQITDEYFRMGRRNVDGYRMYYNPELLSDLFDASQVFDSSRPTPVPPMNGG